MLLINLYYCFSYFFKLMPSSNYCEMSNEKPQNTDVYWKKIFGGSIIQMCPICSYHNINWQKNPVHLNIILLFYFYPRYFTECCHPCVLLRQSEVVQTLYYPSCLEKKMRSHAIWVSLKKDFWGQYLGMPQLQLP